MVELLIREAGNDASSPALLRPRKEDYRTQPPGSGAVAVLSGGWWAVSLGRVLTAQQIGTVASSPTSAPNEAWFSFLTVPDGSSVI
jgi:hypothetical protein